MKTSLRKYLIISLCVTGNLVSFSQTQWNIRFGTEEFTGLQCKDLSWDRPDAVVVSSTGDIYVSGTNSHSTGNPKPNTMGVWVMKFASDGKLAWFRSPSEHFQTCDPKLLSAASNRGVVLAGYSTFTSEKGELNVFSCDPSGNLKEVSVKASDIKIKMDNQLYTAEKVDYPVHVFQDQQGNTGVVLNTQLRIQKREGNVVRSEPVQKLSLVYLSPDMKFISAIALDFPPLLYKITSDNYDYYFRAESHTDGSFVLVLKDKDTRQNITIAKFDRNGTKLWSVTKKYPNTIYNDAVTYLSTGEVAFMVCTQTNDEYSIFDMSGNEIKKFTLKNDGAVAKIKAVENDFVVLYQLGGVGEGTVVVKKINAKGETLWRKTFGQKSSFGIDLEVNRDKSVVVVAYTKEFGACYLDGMLIKTDKEGNTESVPKKYSKAN